MDRASQTIHTKTKPTSSQTTTDVCTAQYFGQCLHVKTFKAEIEVLRVELSDVKRQNQILTDVNQRLQESIQRQIKTSKSYTVDLETQIQELKDKCTLSNAKIIEQTFKYSELSATFQNYKQSQPSQTKPIPLLPEAITRKRSIQITNIEKQAEKRLKIEKQKQKTEYYETRKTAHAKSSKQKQAELSTADFLNWDIARLELELQQLGHPCKIETDFKTGKLLEAHRKRRILLNRYTRYLKEHIVNSTK